jgi:uncharacterized protein (DUF1499 family)
MDRLFEIVQAQPRVQIIDAQGDYMHTLFVSRRLGFKDDVEFLLDREARVIQVRACSRLGYWDLGVNRARVEHLRTLLSS